MSSAMLSVGSAPMNFSPPRLETDRLLLRMATREDVPGILAYYRENRDFLTPFEPARCAEFYTVGFWREQVDKAQFEFSYDQSLKLCLFKKQAPNAVIGKINFHQIQRGVAYACVLGYSLSAQNQGQGYMTEALRCVLDYMFTVQHMHRVGANYMPRNQRSGNVLRRLGFVVEGYARDYLLIAGQWEDHILTSLTNPDWQMPI